MSDARIARRQAHRGQQQGQGERRAVRPRGTAENAAAAAGDEKEAGREPGALKCEDQEKRAGRRDHKA
jgi:hypothetical protein